MKKYLPQTVSKITKELDEKVGKSLDGSKVKDEVAGRCKVV